MAPSNAAAVTTKRWSIEVIEVPQPVLEIAGGDVIMPIPGRARGQHSSAQKELRRDKTEAQTEDTTSGK